MSSHSLSANWTLCVSRPSSGQDPNNSIIVRSPKPSQLPPDHVLIEVDRFGFSANNITYQALGEHPHFRYFDFHAAPEAEVVSAKTHGVFPVWGFGTIVSSTHPKILKGERVYGYLAPTRYLLVPVSSSDVNKFAFYIPRPDLPADRRPYNQILRCATDPQYTATPVAEDLTMLYRPLFWTSYWFEDWLFSSGYRGGVSSILISSASSKTAFCLAYLIGKRISEGSINANTKIIGLTSKKNKIFTEGLNLYHEVHQYDHFLSARSFQGRRDNRWIYVDVAGNEELNVRIASHFASPYTGKLATWTSLGFTNLSPSTDQQLVQQTHTTFAPFSTNDDDTSSFHPIIEHFFMPEWLNVRKHHLTLGEIFDGQNKAWKKLMTDCVGWIKLDRVYGATKVQDAYQRISKHGLGPDKGLIWSLWDGGKERVLSKL